MKVWCVSLLCVMDVFVLSDVLVFVSVIVFCVLVVGLIVVCVVLNVMGKDGMMMMVLWFGVFGCGWVLVMVKEMFDDVGKVCLSVFYGM